mmetsp:Transcript_3540/g.14279  ORF Transcript_3540/g.14279 Transcript_3540/m.14279 type:complete len:255 (-) Transcript_3540:96-860(-)
MKTTSKHVFLSGVRASVFSNDTAASSTLINGSRVRHESPRSPFLALASSTRLRKPCSLVTSAFLAARRSPSPWVSTSSQPITAFSQASAKAANAFSSGAACPPSAPAATDEADTDRSSASRSRANASARAVRSVSAERDRSIGSSVAFGPASAAPDREDPSASPFPPRALEENSAALALRISSICVSCCCRARSRFDASVSRSMSFAVGFTPRPPTVSSGAGSRPLKSRRCAVVSRSPAAAHASSFALSHVVSG